MAINFSINPSQNHNKVPPISPELQLILQQVVDDVVSSLDCAAAMVATLEMDNILPIRAYSITFEPELLRQLEGKIGLSLLGPESVIYLNDKKYQDNLGVRAMKSKSGRPQTAVSARLYDLFRPLVNEKQSDMAQHTIGIKQVIAVPFFLEEEVVGCLFAATCDEFTERDKNFLTAFGKQAAGAIQSQRHLAQIQALERVNVILQANITDETQILQDIVDAVVHKLGYVAAIVATLEVNNALPIRAYAVSFGQGLLKQLENIAGISLISPRSVVYIDDSRYKENLSVRAVKGIDGRPAPFIVSDRLHDLFRPIISQPISDLIQRLTAIRQVIAVPFFIDDEVVGNLFVTTHKTYFSARETELLTTFGQQAAVGLRNARLYRKAEERRQIAQMFGKMAFSATAYIHSLRNHVGVARSYLELLQMIPQLPPNQHAKILASSNQILVNLNQAVDILGHLHEPWQETSADVLTDVNDCLLLAARKAMRGFDLLDDEEEGKRKVTLHKTLVEDLPMIKTSPEMLTEAFRVLAKNAIESMEQKGKQGELRIESSLGDKHIEVVISDSGTGIAPENINRIFEMGWSSKKGRGMGFGLFWTKDYIEGMGGHITVESILDRGTTFYISLPLSTPT
jgi:signal transduction histidine kinase